MLQFVIDSVNRRVAVCLVLRSQCVGPPRAVTSSLGGTVRAGRLVVVPAVAAAPEVTTMAVVAQETGNR